MRYRVFVLAASIGLGVASCGEFCPPTTSGGDAAGSTASGPRPMLPAAPSGPATAAQPAPAVTASTGSARPQTPVVSDDPIPSADAQWTLFCYSIGEFDHIQRANQLKAALKQKTGRNDWYVIHGQDESHLYFGFYRILNNPQTPQDQREVARVKADRELIATLQDDRTNTPFKACSFVPLSAPDPASKPEWNLANVDRDKDPKDPTRAFWSLQIMAFRDNPMRKEAAVQAVEALRKQGVEAYYYHGDSVSSVCLGAWPPGAVKEHIVDPMMPDVATADPNVLLVVCGEQVPETLTPRPQKGASRVEAVIPKLDVLDRGMADTIGRFPSHAVNYVIRMHRGVKKGPNGEKMPVEIPDPSFLVMVPRPKGNGLYDSDVVLPPPIASGQGSGYGQYGSPRAQAPSAFVDPGQSRRAASAYDPSSLGSGVGTGAAWGTAPGGTGSASARQFGARGGSTTGGPTVVAPSETNQQPAAPRPTTPGAGRLRRLSDE